MSDTLQRFLTRHEGKIRCALVAAGVLSVILGILSEYSWLREARDAYMDGFKRRQILGLSLMIFTVGGAGIIFFATRHLKRLVRDDDRIETTTEAAILLILMLMSVLSQIRYFDNDEFEAMHNAWLMIEGTIPAFSATSFHTPLLQWIIIPFMKVTGESSVIIQTMRIFIFFASCASLWLVYKITKELFRSRTTALFAVLILITSMPWLRVSPEIRPDNVMIFFALLSFWFLMMYYKKSRVGYLALFGLSAILAVLGKQNAVIFYFALGLVFAYDVLFKKRLLTKKALVAGIIALVALLQVDAVWMFFEVNIRKHLIPNNIKFLPTDYLRMTWKFNPALFFLFFLQLLLPLRIAGEYEIFRKYITSVALTGLTFLFLMNRPYLQEFLAMAVFMSIMGANVLTEMKQKMDRKVSYFVIGVIIFPALLYIPKTSIKYPFTEDLKTTKDILEMSARDDLVFDSYGKPIFRHHPMEPDYLMYTRYFISDKSRYKRLYAVKKSNVKYLIKDQYYPDYPADMKKWFEENFVQTEKNPNIFVRIDPGESARGNSPPAEGGEE